MQAIMDTCTATLIPAHPTTKPKTALAAGLLQTTLSVSLAPTQPNLRLKAMKLTPRPSSTGQQEILKPDDPFPYLGVHITVDLNWTHQLTHMTTKLSLKLERLKNFFASPKQTMDIIRTAIVPSIADSLFQLPLAP
jgi:hypothetical protein